VDDRTELVAAITDDLAHRTSWEVKQGDLYRARFRGLRRSAPPWPGASDINWPLIDGIVDKLKPYYLQQLYANELLATFTPAVADPDVMRMCGTAAQWFDYELKQQSNLETAILHVIDYMLMLGRPAMKVCWDEDDDGLEFHAISPEKIIVPSSTSCLEEADRIVHVMQYSRDAFKRSEEFRDVPEETLELILGSRTDPHTGGNSAKLAALRREGITQGPDNEVIVWEVWTQIEDDKWRRETFSPLQPDIDLRETVEDPLGDIGQPFVDFPYEITQSDWYAPRGAGEVVLPFQAQLTKLLNEKNDAMTLSNRPLFRAERDGVDANLRWKPGQILPVGIQPVTMPSPPIQFDVQINLMRQVAEQLIGTPDFGMAREGDMRKARTATEMQQVAQMNAQSGDLRMRVFRQSLGRLYQKAWSFLQQYATKKGNRKFWRDDQVEEIGSDVLGKAYKIKPTGSADGTTRERLFGKAVARLQMYNQDPFIDQGELRKSVLEADDAGLVKRLFRDPLTKQATQGEDQASEIAIMRLGFPAVVTPADDHVVHLKTLLAYVQQQHATGQPPAPTEMQRLQEHMAAHVQALGQVDPKAAKAALDAIQVIGASLAPQQEVPA